MSDQEKVNERRRKIVKALATLGRGSEGWAKKIGAMFATTTAAIERDLVALEEGELPPPVLDPSEQVSKRQLELAAFVEKADTAEQTDAALKKLSGAGLYGDVDPAGIKSAVYAIMARRAFLAAVEAAKAAAKDAKPGAGGAQIIIQQAPPIDFEGGQ